MKKVLFGAVVALVGLTTTAKAEYTVSVRGTDYPLVALMDSCVNANGGSEAQLKCFVALAGLVKQQSGAAPASNMSVSQALDTLRGVAEYQDAESGLRIAGNDCRINILYYNNYYFMSRRNVTSIDLFSAQFDVSQMQYDQTIQAQGASGAYSKGLMQPGSLALFRGGEALESGDNGFESKPASMSVDAYAKTIAQQLSLQEGQGFDFVLVHPKLSQKSTEIWGAFQSLVNACKG